jgi:hypothetical protein
MRIEALANVHYPIKAEATPQLKLSVITKHAPEIARRHPSGLATAAGGNEGAKLIDCG